MGGFKIGKNNFLYQVSPFNLAHKIGFQTPVSRMVEYGEPLGRAIEMSGDPAQRWVRSKVQKAWGGLVNPKSYYSPAPFDPSKLNAQFAQQNQLTQKMMSDSLLDQQALANANQTVLSQDLASKNAAQQQNITAGLQAANLGMQTTAPTTTPATLALQPATQNKTTTLNQFTMPSISGLTFGGT